MRHPHRSPKAALSRVSPAFLALCLMLGSCTAESGPVAGSPEVAQGPRQGSWSGMELEFVLKGGAISQLKIYEQPCDEGGCVQVCDDSPCASVFFGTVPGEFSLDGGLLVQTDALELSGSFSDEQHASGKLVLLSQAGCCKRIGAWTAEWTEDLGGGGTGPGTGKPGPIDWGGASSGSAHPGPSLGSWKATFPKGLSQTQSDALTQLNDLRTQLGAGPVEGSLAIAQAAQAHADFYVAHVKSYQSSGLSPHEEDESFGEGFTGKHHNERMKAAGFEGSPGAEIMAFSGSVSGAIAGWLATLYHRIPMIDPRSSAAGYGSASAGSARTEVMDFARRGAQSGDPIIVYPWPGQDDVASKWGGGESPQPKPPPGNYPSGPMITATMPWPVTFGPDHALLNEKGAPVPHMWLTAANDPTMKMMASSTAAIYAHSPLQAGQTYTVIIPFSHNNKPQELKWRFTIGAK